jgi:hypothetical protein
MFTGVAGKPGLLSFLPEVHEVHQIDRERLLNPRPSQRSGLSSTSGASNGFGGLFVAVAASGLLAAELTTLKGLVVVEVGPLAET